MDQPTNKPRGLIIVRLLGGLGNQMFQYAFGRSLSVTHNRALKFDLSIYANKKAKWAMRAYALNHFSLSAQPAADQELKPFQKYLRPNTGNKILRRASSIIPAAMKSYIFEPLGKNFTFNPNLLSMKLPETVYFDGFWQTEKYFMAIEDLLRRDFEFKGPPDKVNQDMIGQIAGREAVAIHIRHGDNATKVAAKHGVLPIDYYYKAVADLVKKLPQPHFYIFSDDPAWAKANLKLDYPSIFVTHNGEEKHYEDLRLMAHCKHHIIGNSTFSWWGAWLGKKTGQQVYAPSRYHMDAKIPMADLYPADWILIDV